MLADCPLVNALVTEIFPSIALASLSRSPDVTSFHTASHDDLDNVDFTPCVLVNQPEVPLRCIRKIVYTHCIMPHEQPHCSIE